MRLRNWVKRKLVWLYERRGRFFSQYNYGLRTDQDDNNYIIWRRSPCHSTWLLPAVRGCSVQSRAAAWVIGRGDVGLRGLPLYNIGTGGDQRSGHSWPWTIPSECQHYRTSMQQSVWAFRTLFIPSLHVEKTIKPDTSSPRFSREDVSFNDNWLKPCCAVRIISFHRHTCL